MPRFTLYFETEALRERLESSLSQISSFFVFDVRTGTPATITPYSTDGQPYTGYPYPADPGTAYVFHRDNWQWDGVSLGDGGGRAAIQVEDNDDIDVVIMRIWHELLHAVGQPADDMEKLAPQWQRWYEIVLWWIWPYLLGSRHCPFWHKRFYAWLTRRAIEREDRLRATI